MWWGPPGLPSSHSILWLWQLREGRERGALGQNRPVPATEAKVPLWESDSWGVLALIWPSDTLYLFFFNSPRPNFIHSGGCNRKAITDKSPSGCGFGWSPDWLFHGQLEKFAKVPMTNFRNSIYLFILRSNVEGGGNPVFWTNPRGERKRRGVKGLVCETQSKVLSPVSLSASPPSPHHFPLLQGFVYITQVVWLDSSGEFLLSCFYLLLNFFDRFTPL